MRASCPPSWTTCRSPPVVDRGLPPNVPPPGRPDGGGTLALIGLVAGFTLIFTGFWWMGWILAIVSVWFLVKDDCQHPLDDDDDDGPWPGGMA